MSARDLFGGWKTDADSEHGRAEWRDYVVPFLDHNNISTIDGGVWSASVDPNGWFARLYWSLMADFLPGRPHDYIRILQESWDLGRPTPEAEAWLTLKRMSE